MPLLPLQPDTRATLSKRLGQFGLIYFAFGSFYGPAQANQGFLIVLASLLINCSIDIRSLCKDSLFLTSFLFMTYIFLRGCFAIVSAPAEAATIIDETSDWMMLALLPTVFMAAAFNNTRFKPYHLIGVGLAGFSLKIAMQVDWRDWLGYFEQYFIVDYARASFGYSFIHLALWSLFLLLGLIIYFDDFVRDRSKKISGIKLLILIAAFLFLIFIIIISKTRSIWALSCIFIPLCVFFKAFEKFKIKIRNICILTILVLILPSYLIYENTDFFSQRIIEEKEVIIQIFDSKKGDQIPPTSIGLRYYMIMVFMENFDARPIFGWGPGLSKNLLKQSPHPGMKDVSHFHNIFIETYLQLGLIGMVFFGLMFGVLFKTALTLKHELYDVRKFRWFLLCNTTIFCLVGLIEHTLWSSATPYVFTLVGCIAYAPRAKTYNRPATLLSPDSSST